MTNEFCCPACNQKSFKIIPYQIRMKKEKVLMVVCESCKKPLGLIQSIESKELMARAPFVRFNDN